MILALVHRLLAMVFLFGFWFVRGFLISMPQVERASNTSSCIRTVVTAPNFLPVPTSAPTFDFLSLKKEEKVPRMVAGP